FERCAVLQLQHDARLVGEPDEDHWSAQHQDRLVLAEQLQTAEQLCVQQWRIRFQQRCCESIGYRVRIRKRSTWYLQLMHSSFWLLHWQIPLQQCGVVRARQLESDVKADVRLWDALLLDSAPVRRGLADSQLPSAQF